MNSPLSDPLLAVTLAYAHDEFLVNVPITFGLASGTIIEGVIVHHKKVLADIDVSKAAHGPGIENYDLDGEPDEQGIHDLLTEHASHYVTLAVPVVNGHPFTAGQHLRVSLAAVEWWSLGYLAP